LADRGNFDMITKKINGGYKGKKERDIYKDKALEVLKK
jgi:predicted chitinase